MGYFIEEETDYNNCIDNIVLCIYTVIKLESYSE